MKLREYQEAAVLQASTKLASGKRKIIFQLPTGAGKTICFSAISNRYITRSPKSVLILVHRIELLNQTRRTLYDAFNISSQPITAGMKTVPASRVYVGMIESTIKRIPDNIGLVIIDEAHLANFFKIHDYFPTQFIIGFTATPISADRKKPLRNYYEDIVCTIQIQDLIKMGSLCQNITYCPRDTVDRGSLAVSGNDFDERQMAEAFSNPKFVNNTVQSYLKYAPNTKALIFNVNVDHSKKVNDAFICAGLNAKHLDGTMSVTERRHILEWFSTTPGAILNNVGIATTGTDIPTIESVFVNKGTRSMPLLMQMIGRGGRPTETKSAFAVIDLGGNVLVHGDWDSERDWANLFHNPPTSRTKEGAAPVKYCPECDAILPVQAKSCKYCLYAFPVEPEPIEAELSDFIIVTKGIDVAAIIEANKEKKEYYPFYKMGRDLATEARKSVPKMTDEKAEFILQKYFALAKEWCNAKGKRFNQWHQEKAKETLYNELSQRYKSWNKQQQATA